MSAKLFVPPPPPVSVMPPAVMSCPLLLTMRDLRLTAILPIAGAVFFAVFFGTLLKKKRAEAALEFPVSETLHDENIAFVQSLRPWIVAAAILLIVAYTMPFVELAQAKYEGAPPYSPSSPVAQSR